MSIPIVPDLTRKSGEKTFLRFIPTDTTKGFNVTDINGEGGFMVAHVTPRDAGNAYPAVNDIVVIFGAGDDKFIGWHTVTNVDEVAGTVTFDDTMPDEDHTMPEDTMLIAVDEMYVTGQATDSSGGSTSNTDTFSTLGFEDEDLSTGIDYDCSLTVFVDDELEVAKLLGVDSLDRVARIHDDVDYHVHIMLDTFSSRKPATAVLLYSTTYESVKWDSWNTTNGAGKQNFAGWDLSGSAKDKYVLKWQ